AKLKALREQVAELERQLEPLASERISAMAQNEREATALRKRLRADATECQALQHAIEHTRQEIATNVHGRRAALMDGAAYSRIPIVLALLLDAYRDCERIAIEEPDVAAGLERVRKQLAAAGIRLEKST